MPLLPFRMSFCRPDFGTARLSTLLASVLALLLLTFGSTSVDVYAPVVAPSTNLAEVPTEEVAHHGLSARVTSGTRVEFARARSVSGTAVYLRWASAPQRAARAAVPAAAAEHWRPRPSGSASTPLRC